MSEPVDASSEMRTLHDLHDGADKKAFPLFATAGVSAAVLAVAGGTLAAVAVAAWAVTGGLALAAVWPRLGKLTNGPLAWSRMTREGAAGLTYDAAKGLQRAQYGPIPYDLIDQAKLAVLKFRLVQAGCAAAAAALALTVPALLIGG